MPHRERARNAEVGLRRPKIEILTPSLAKEYIESHKRLTNRLKEKALLAVIYTANPHEETNPVVPSLQVRPFKSYKDTAEHIAESLKQSGYQHIKVLSDVELLHIIVDPKKQKPDITWLNTGGIQGEDPMSHTAGLLEGMGWPYIGHAPTAYGNADNKILADAILSGRKVPVPQSESVLYEDDFLDAEQFLKAMDQMGIPLIMKPINGRGSVGVERLDPHDNPRKKITEALKIFPGGIKIEEFLPGEEITVTMIGTGKGTIAFPPVLRSHDENGIFGSLDSQPVAGRIELLDDAHPLFNQAITTAAAAHGGLGLKSLSRIDMRAGTDGVLRVIDTNPKPDLGKPGAPSIAEISSGLSFDELAAFIVACRIDRGFKKHPNFRAKWA